MNPPDDPSAGGGATGDPPGPAPISRDWGHMNMNSAMRRLGVESTSRGTIPSLTPLAAHARLLVYFSPLVDRLIDDLGAVPARPLPAVGRHEYERFPLFDVGLDWRPAWERVSLAGFWSASEYPFSPPDRLTRVPECAYPGLSERLAGALAVTLEVIASTVGSAEGSRHLFETLRNDAQARQLIRDCTILGYSYGQALDTVGLARAVEQTLRVSAVSEMQAIAVLAREPVPGITDSAELLRAIVNGDVVREFAMLLPPNLLGPQSREGFGFPAPLLEADAAGGVHLHPQLRERLIAERKRYREKVLQPGGIDRGQGRGQVGMRCPAGMAARGRPSPLSRLGSAMVALCESPQLGAPGVRLG